MSPRPAWPRDLVVGLLVAAVAEVELWLSADEVEGSVLGNAGLNLLIVPALAVRRTHPLAAALVGAVSMALQPLAGTAPVATGFLVLLFVLASLGWYAAPKDGVIGVLAVVAGGLVFDATTDDFVLADLVVNVVLLVAAWGAGRAVRVASDRRVAAEVAADRAARVAVQEERGRISRDLHDSVAHTLTLITLQAGSARERASSPDVTEVLGSIEEGAREGLAEMHRFLRLLDSTPEEQPGIAHLPALVEGVRRGGLAVSVDVSVEEVPSGVSTAVYRVVQEGLTNVVRHSDAQEVAVAVQRDGSAVVASVSSIGVARAASLPGSGRGLVGLRERLATVGGTITSSATEDGWRLVARIPLPGGASWSG
ncbi:sensor histidine kinase [Nocardioides caldifontis]|uniref:sensor histidine kinase n=1 Tax=Nocardioides caldifontis TaxID=2588938 RepID=UPI0011DF8A8F|nr:histidine kinase [Nocardioides caldifontis]